MLLNGNSPLISSETAISLATVIVLIAAATKISWLLSRIDARTDGLPDKVANLEKLLGEAKQEVAILHQHVQTLEADVNNLWAAFRNDELGSGRRDRPPRMPS